MSIDSNSITKLAYLKETKRLIKEAINDGNTVVTDETPFRNYVQYVNGYNDSPVRDMTIDYGILMSDIQFPTYVVSENEQIEVVNIDVNNNLNLIFNDNIQSCIIAQNKLCTPMGILFTNDSYLDYEDYIKATLSQHIDLSETVFNQNKYPKAVNSLECRISKISKITSGTTSGQYSVTITGYVLLNDNGTKTKTGNSDSSTYTEDDRTYNKVSLSVTVPSINDIEYYGISFVTDSFEYISSTVSDRSYYHINVKPTLVVKTSSDYKTSVINYCYIKNTGLTNDNYWSLRMTEDEFNYNMGMSQSTYLPPSISKTI